MLERQTSFRENAALAAERDAPAARAAALGPVQSELEAAKAELAALSDARGRRGRRRRFPLAGRLGQQRAPPTRARGVLVARGGGAAAAAARAATRSARPRPTTRALAAADEPRPRRPRPARAPTPVPSADGDAAATLAAGSGDAAPPGDGKDGKKASKRRAAAR